MFRHKVRTDRAAPRRQASDSGRRAFRDLKNRVSDQIKLVDPSFSGLLADIRAPAAAAAAGAAASTPAARTYTAQPGDNLPKISKQFYGEAKKYMKVFGPNRDKLADAGKARVGNGSPDPMAFVLTLVWRTVSRREAV